MHADYFAPAHSRIRIFTNHIEFYNPGGLPKPIEELKAKDLSLPRNPLITKLFRMVRLAENAGYGFDRIEANWKTYNNTAPEYDISFDATILKLYTKSQEDTKETSETVQKQFVAVLERLQNELKKEPADIAYVMELLENNFNSFVQYTSEHFGDSSETLRKHFGNSSERLREHFGNNTVVLLLHIIFDKKTTAKDAAKTIGVSDRTVETYLTKLKEANVIERVGSPTFGGYWTLKTDKK
jgi:predicted HTH transcriptional regulator